MKFLFRMLFWLAVPLVCANGPSTVAQDTASKNIQPKFTLSRIEIFTEFSNVSNVLVPVGQSPRVPTKAACAEEFSECNYVDNKGIVYATNGEIIGEITWSRGGRSWSKSLPYGLNPIDSPEIIYQKLKRQGFNLKGGFGRDPQDNNIFISWAINENRRNTYFVTISFDSQNRLSKFNIRANEW